MEGPKHDRQSPDPGRPRPRARAHQVDPVPELELEHPPTAPAERAPRPTTIATLHAKALEVVARLRAAGFDVIRSDALAAQDRELERYRVAEAAGGFRVERADLEAELEQARSMGSKANRALEVLAVYIERIANELPERGRARILEDLDAELEAVGLMRTADHAAYRDLPLDPARYRLHRAHLDRLLELEERLLEAWTNALEEHEIAQGPAAAAQWLAIVDLLASIRRRDEPAPPPTPATRELVRLYDDEGREVTRRPKGGGR